MTVNEHLYHIYVQQQRQHGHDRALANIRGLDKYSDAELAELLDEIRHRQDRIETGFPPHVIAISGANWYTGPDLHDRFWPDFLQGLTDEGRIPVDQLDKLHESTEKVIANTHDPGDQAARWSSKGLVVGYVQSGKTTNFSAVIAKAVDNGYNLVIVLSGIHNGLREQTQKRLDRQLFDRQADGWVRKTDAEHDFLTQTTPLVSDLPRPEDRKAVVVVAKKNKSPLRKLKRWLEDASRGGGLRNAKVLVIDDEADQATVETAKINPLLRDILSVLPRYTFIGYTATPFANLLIDPSGDDLYPRNFILNMPRPDGYFGTEMIFGRDDIDDGVDEPVDGYDMVRIIPPSELPRLGPRRNASFEPEVTASLARATYWFWLATAARRVRAHPDDNEHSTMLVHTTTKTGVHRDFQVVLREFCDETLQDLRADSQRLRARLEAMWTRETAAVPASDFGHATIPFDKVWAALPAVVDATRVITDNSRTPRAERLDYDNGPVTAIAVGGNTLSRGLTLEGLTVSFFVRAAKAYDTLLQMGRWFGFRNGYEDLPRIYMTDELRSWFRHLAAVEHEIRLDIARYEEQGYTPLEVGVRIRTHPVLLVTQKLGAARQSYTSYGDRRVQVRYFRHRDRDWLQKNLVAARELVATLDANGYPVDEARSDGSILWRDVSVADVKRFLQQYASHDDSPDLDRGLLLAYIDKEVETGSLERWSVALMSGTDAMTEKVRLGAREVPTIVRSRLVGDATDKVDIKTLMSKEHRVTDLASLTPAEARRLPESRLVDERNKDSEYRRRGLLLLYPIDRTSHPGALKARDRQGRAELGAVEPVVGIGLVFPGNGDRTVLNNYISVDLSNASPVEDVDDELSDEHEDGEPAA